MQQPDFGERVLAVENAGAAGHSEAPLFITATSANADMRGLLAPDALRGGDSVSMGPVQLAIKRGMDIVLSILLLLILLPVMLAIALAIRVTSPGPVLFRQTRLGHHGRPFTILKFRSMTVTEDGENIRQAQKNDWRLTRVGRRLRRTSLDELPQLINVLRGEMSLVGPRPHARAHDFAFARLVADYGERQCVKPGITGWAQVNGLRGEIVSIEQLRTRIEHDLYYTRTANLAFDIKILMRTVVVVLGQRNAH